MTIKIDSTNIIDIKTKGKKHLVIVESPAKSKTIKKFLGSGFEVKASYGHIVDLPSKNLGVDINNNFNPTYQVSPDKKKVIAELKKDANDCDVVWIATDEDREGEAIGRHVANQLGLDINTTPRIVFHEITKDAIENAVKNPRKLDINLVDAQQARRVLDRLVGFELSPVLWKKVKAGLSAGRVQSVAVRLIVEREKEIENFKNSSSFKVYTNFLGDEKKLIPAELNKKLTNEKQVIDFLESLNDANYKISNIDIKPGRKSPSAPFTTSTLQQEASRKLGYPVGRTMQIAQKLYESGHITYMRTDSLNLSETAIKQAEKEIIKEFGKQYSKPTRYKSKSKGAQEAHECIRPTHMENHMMGDDAQQKRLYDLIWKRTIASQMMPAELEKTKVEIDISNNKNKFIANGEVIKFDGFLKLYIESNDDENVDEESSNMLPKMYEGEELSVSDIIAKEVFTKHLPRYTEASLVKKLEEQGIGRPSTYAPTISTIQKRGYVVREDRIGEKRDFLTFILKNRKIDKIVNQQITGTEKGKLFPTDIGIIVTDFLVNNFTDILDYGFTASVEEQFDNVASGKIKWYNMIGDFYFPFHKEVENTIENADFAKSERILGDDPKTGKPVLARMGKYGPLIQLGNADDTDKKFAPIRDGKHINSITLEEALDMFILPKNLGEYDGNDVLVNIGRFGPYIKWKDMFVSLKKGTLEQEGDDPYTINITRAIELIEEKKIFEQNKYIKEFDYKNQKIHILNGRYGPYIKYNKKNFKLTKELKNNLENITIEQCLKIIN